MTEHTEINAANIGKELAMRRIHITVTISMSVREFLRKMDNDTLERLINEAVDEMDRRIKEQGVIDKWTSRGY